jgi:hypothetical protein
MASFKESFLQNTLFGPHFDNDSFADRPIFIKLTILKESHVKLTILNRSHVKLSILEGSHVKLTIFKGSHVKLTPTTTLKIVLATAQSSRCKRLTHFRCLPCPLI